MSALAEALVAAQAELPCALGKDARSEARYVSDPSEEPDTREVAEAPFRDPGFACIVDESAGFRG